MNVKEVDKQVRYDKWAALIMECRESGLTVNEWCASNNINPPTYYYYLKKVRERAIAQSSIESNNPFCMVPVSSSASETDNNSVSIYYGNARIEISEGTSVNMIRLILEAIK